MYGSQFAARNELATWTDQELNLEQDFDPQLNDWLTLGADLRILYTNFENAPSSGTRIMQGALHLTAQLHPKFKFYFSKDWNLDYQAAAIANILPWDGYLKAGRFLPTYGIRPDDHTTFIRDGLFGGAFYTDTGIEVGFQPEGWDFTAGLLNGTSSGFNDNRRYALTFRGARRFRAGDLNLLAGGSLYGDDYADEGWETLWYGAFYGFSYHGFTYIGEVDITENHPSSLYDLGLPGNPKGLVSSQALFYQVFRGFYAKAGHDFHDYNIDYETGSAQRFTLGAQWFPLGFLELQANLRLRQTSDIDGDTKDTVEFDAQIHLFY